MIARQVDLHKFNNRYKIVGFPTLIIFTSDGKMIFKKAGAFDDPAAFMEFLEKAMDEDEQHFFLSEEFNAGNRDQDVLTQLLGMATSRKNERLVKSVNETINVNSANTKNKKK